MSASSLSNSSNGSNSSGDAQKKPSAGSLGALRRFAQEREPARSKMEQCELCNEPIPSIHTHLLDVTNRTLICACQACSLLFSNAGAGGGKYRLVPRHSLALSDFQMTDEQWDQLMIPVNMVYMFPSTTAGHVVAFYPSPAGAMESLLTLEHWEELARENPILNALESDVEALLINRTRNTREYFIVPIDVCYQLVGLIRIYWKGLSGGEEVWKAIGEFFADLRAKAREVTRSERSA